MIFVFDYRKRERRNSYFLHLRTGKILEIEKWCKDKFGDKEPWERKLPSTISPDEEERKLGETLNRIGQIIKKYEGIPIEQIKLHNLLPSFTQKVLYISSASYSFSY